MKATGGVIGVQGYSRHRRCTYAEVAAAIRSGLLARSVTKDEAGRILIDIGIADEEWVAGEVKPVKTPIATPAVFPSMRQSRSRMLYFKAAQEELRYQQQARQLLPAEAVRRVYFRRGRDLRDGLLAIPDRIAAILAAETDPLKVKALLRSEIADAIRALSRDLEEAVDDKQQDAKLRP